MGFSCEPGALAFERARRRCALSAQRPGLAAVAGRKTAPIARRDCGVTCVAGDNFEPLGKLSIGVSSGRRRRNFFPVLAVGCARNCTVHAHQPADVFCWGSARQPHFLAGTRLRFPRAAAICGSRDPAERSGAPANLSRTRQDDQRLPRSQRGGQHFDRLRSGTARSFLIGGEFLDGRFGDRLWHRRRRGGCRERRSCAGFFFLQFWRRRGRGLGLRLRLSCSERIVCSGDAARNTSWRRSARRLQRFRRVARLRR